MSTGHLGTIHGLVLASEAALPLVAAFGRAPDVEYSVALRESAHRAPIHSRADDPDDPSVVEHWIGDYLEVEFPEQATFVLTRERIVLVADEADDPDLVEHLLLDHVVPRVVALRGDLVLHASGAVGPSGGAHLFLGATGAGKSTLAVALAASGWALLDDDSVRVTSSEGDPAAVPGTGSVRLLPDSVAALVPGSPAGRAVAQCSAKHRFPADRLRLHLATAPAPVAGVYVLTRPGPPALDRLGLAEAVTAIARHGFHVSAEPGEITRRVFEQASALAAASLAWTLTVPEGLEQLHAAVSLLEDVDAALAGETRPSRPVRPE